MEAVNLENIWEDWHIDGPPIGSGSFGTVYKAHKIEQNGFGRGYESAVKVIRVPSDDSEIRGFLADGMSREEIAGYYENALKGLVGEIDLMESLKGAPNIVIIEDYKVIRNEDGIGWTIYIRMELLKNLNQYRIEHPLSVEDIVRLGIDICSALDYCGKKRIIHRDIKPDNIFINSFGDFKLGDFGIARQLEMTNANLSQKGTSAYMAPEIFRREPYSSSVDIYSLGMVLYRLLNGGRLPFLPTHAAGPADTQRALERRLNGEVLPPPSNCDEALAAIIAKACDADKFKRWASPSQMRTELVHYLENRKAAGAGAAAPTGSGQGAGSWGQSQPSGSGQSAASWGQSQPSGSGESAASGAAENPAQSGDHSRAPENGGSEDTLTRTMYQMPGSEKSGSTDEFDASDDKTVHMFMDNDPVEERTRGMWDMPENDRGDASGPQKAPAGGASFGGPGGAADPSKEIEEAYRQYQQRNSGATKEAGGAGSAGSANTAGSAGSAGSANTAGGAGSAGTANTAGGAGSAGTAKNADGSSEKWKTTRTPEEEILDQMAEKEKKDRRRRIIIGSICGAAAAAAFFFFVPVSLNDTLFDKVRYAVSDSQTRAGLYVKKGDDSQTAGTYMAYYKKALEETPGNLDALAGALRSPEDWKVRTDTDDWDEASWLNMLEILTDIGASDETPGAALQVTIEDRAYRELYNTYGLDLIYDIENYDVGDMDVGAQVTGYFQKFDEASAALNGKADLSEHKEADYEEFINALNINGDYPDVEKSLVAQALAEFPDNETFNERQTQINNDALAQLDAQVDEALDAGDTAKAYEICASMQAINESYYNDTMAKINEQVLNSTEAAVIDAMNQGNIQGAYELCATMESLNADRYNEVLANIQNFENTQNFLNSLKALMDAKDYEGMKNAIQSDTTYAGGTYYLVDGIYKYSVESGTGMIYDGNGIYYGAIENNTRKGQGSQFRLYSNGKYAYLEGPWNGQPNGECTETSWDTDGDMLVTTGNYTDGYENGTMTMSWSRNGYNWSAQYTAENGKIVSEVTQDSEGHYIYARAYAADGASAWYYYNTQEDLDGPHGFWVN